MAENMLGPKEEKVSEPLEEKGLDMASLTRAIGLLKNKNKEKLLLRREEILKRISEDITMDEKQILKLELNQVILELSKLK